RVHEKADRAMREFLDTCKANDLPVLVYLMPEGDEFRTWYKEGTEEAIEKYLAVLKHDYNLEIVDARRWLEERCFFDSQHLLQPGAHRFSIRFSKEYLKPWLADHPAIVQAGGRQHVRSMVPMAIPNAP